MTDQSTRCPKCGTTRPEDFYQSVLKQSLHGRKSVPCKKCYRAETVRVKKTEKAVAISMYGEGCAKCGETRLAYLCLDHVVPGAGNRERLDLTGKPNATAYGAYVSLGLLGQKVEGVQVLCVGCHAMKTAAERVNKDHPGWESETADDWLRSGSATSLRPEIRKTSKRAKKWGKED